MILSSFCIILTKQQTLSVTRPFDSSLALYNKRSIVTMRLSCTVMEIWRLKDNGVTRLIFWGHVTSSVTKERWKKGKRKRKEKGRERERRKGKEVKGKGKENGKGKGNEKGERGSVREREKGERRKRKRDRGKKKGRGKRREE